MTPPEPQEAQPPTTRPRAGPRFGPSVGVPLPQTSTPTRARCPARPPWSWATVGGTAYAPADGTPRLGHRMGFSFQSGVCCTFLTFTCT